jgi:tellurite resistance protein TerC
LATDFLGKPAWIWFTFFGIVVALLAFDLGVLHKSDKEIGVPESLLLSAGYISAALIFGAWVWWSLGAQSGMDCYTGFLIEKSLSMDKVFVIALIFGFFAIPRQYQHRVLFWGILGLIVLRALVIGLGATLVSQFSWVLYVFGAFLIFTGIKMWVLADQLKYALALVLVFIGSKNFLVGIIGKIAPVISLSVTFGLIAGAVLVSLWKTRGLPAPEMA